MSPLRAPGLPRGVLAGSFLALALVAQVASLGPAGPAVAGRLGISLATAGMLVPIHSVGALIGILWWGRAQGRVPSSRLLAAGTLLLLAGAVLAAVNPGGSGPPQPDAIVFVDLSRPGAFAVLALGVVLLGLGFGLLGAGVNTVLTASGVGPGLLNLLHGTYGLASIGFPLLVGLADMRAVYLLVAVGCVALLVPMRAAPPLRRPPADGGVAAARSRPWVVMLAVAMGVEIGSAGWAAPHLVGLGRTPAEASTAVAGFFAAFAAVRFLLAPFVHRRDPAQVVRGGLLLAAVAAVAAWVGPWPTAAWLLVGIGIGPVFPTTLAWLTGAHTDDRAATRLMVGGAVGGTLLPAGIGGLVALLGTGAIPAAIAVIAVAAWALARRLPGLDAAEG